MNPKVTFYVSEEAIAKWEEAYLENGGKSPYPCIAGVPEQFVNGSGRYQCVNGKWKKV